LFKLFLYTDKVSFNAESRIEVVLSMTSFNVRWLRFPFKHPMTSFYKARETISSWRK